MRCLVSRPLIPCGLFVLSLPWGAFAQSPASPPAPAATTFLNRSTFAVGFSGLASDDPRFSWIASLNADIDVVDYRTGRLNFWGQYEGVLGSERRPLDLNHENYAVEGSFTRRVRASELAAVFHHVSRHLTDREHDGVFAWNTLTFRAAHGLMARGTRYGGHFDVSKVLQHSNVDYGWIAELRASVDHRLTPRTSLAAEIRGTLAKSNSQSSRHHQFGDRYEAGVVFDGHAGAAKLYAAYERRIDGYPLEHHRVGWLEFGFKLMGGK